VPSTPSTDQSGPVAFIGLGQMGAPMARRLIAEHFTVLGYDISEAARRALSGQTSIQVVDDAVDAVNGAEVVILMLPNSAVVERAVLSSGLLDQISAGSLLIDMGSSEPLATRALAEHAAAQGIATIDAPVSGGVAGAVAGTLTIMVGGADADIERARPVLGALGSSVVHVGGVGAGHAVKALNNLLSATHLLVSAEALAVGRQFGLDPATMLKAINGSSGRSGSTEAKLPKFVLSSTYDSGFRLALMLKDMRIAVDLAREIGTPAALGEAAVDLWARAADALEEGADHTEIARWAAGDEGPA
jgi:3-hydroxyisobutyrate dehydrogenase